MRHEEAHKSFKELRSSKHGIVHHKPHVQKNFDIFWAGLSVTLLFLKTQLEKNKLQFVEFMIPDCQYRSSMLLLTIYFLKPCLLSAIYKCKGAHKNMGANAFEVFVWRVIYDIICITIPCLICFDDREKNARCGPISDPASTLTQDADPL